MGEKEPARDFRQQKQILRAPEFQQTLAIPVRCEKGTGAGPAQLISSPRGDFLRSPVPGSLRSERSPPALTT